MGAEFVRNTRVLPGVDLGPPDKEDEEETSLWAHNPVNRDHFRNRLSFDSNHNVIVDADGNWITSLHSGHGGTPGYFFDGVEANGSTVESDVMGPGRRQIAPLAATIVAKDGKPWLALGTPGFPPQPVTEVLVSILEYGMDPKAAAEAPRFWQPSENGKRVRIEARISEDVRKGMASRGFKLVELTEYDWHTGSFQIVWRNEKTGKLHGVTDPRRLGYAQGY
jgi:gamma-glutamyltranspeptidase/glutathione hydrolase